MKEVLILNDTYTPINIVSMKKAYKMTVKSSIFEKIGRKHEYHVDILELYDAHISPNGTSYPQPAVLHIAHYKKPAKSTLKTFAPFTRRNVWVRDGGACQYCGKKIKLDDMHWDHVVPRKDGGRTTWSNIVCSCLPCNSKKADKTLKASGLRLLKKPEPVYNEVAPTLSARERIIRKMDKKVMPIEWKNYLEWIGVFA